jgi:serine/threonine protein kinase
MAQLLKVIAGPDQGKTFPIPASGSLVIGRGVDADANLTDGRVSRRHFRLLAGGGQVRLLDLGSKAGTVVNNIAVHGEQGLHTGDILVVGDTYLQMISDDPADSTDSSHHAIAAPSAPQPPVRPAVKPPAPAKPAQAKPTRPGPSTPMPPPKSSKGGPPTPMPAGKPAKPAQAPSGSPLVRSAVGPETLARLMNTMMAHFTLGPLLGIGKVGAVFRARDNREQMDVALKIFMPEFSRDDDDMQRFVRAARTARDLRQLNLVSVHNAGRTDGTCWLSMELIEGPSLAWVVQQAGTAAVPDFRMAQRILRDVTRALIYLHGKSILHRNLTPENLLVSSADSLVKVSDLISVKAQEGKLAQDITQEGQIIGDLRYLAPERTIGDPNEDDPRGDLYSLGAIVYAVLTGKPPIEGDNPVDTIRKIRQTPAVQLRRLLPTIPAALDGVVMRLLAKDPDQRFPDATALLRHLTQQRLLE